MGSAARAALASRSFAYYCDYVHNRPLFAHQKLWVEYMTSRRGQKLLLVSPPESLKSTMLRMYLEWRIGNNVEETILLVMRSLPQRRSEQAKGLVKGVFLHPQGK